MLLVGGKPFAIPVLGISRFQAFKIPIMGICCTFPRLEKVKSKFSGI